MQNETLSIFEPACQDNEEKIFAHGIREEIKRMCHELGGVTETARKLNLKFKQVCEWPWRGKPIPLKQLDRMIEFLPAEKRLEYRQRFDEKEFYLSANYSGHKMKFPKKLSPELCYIVGLLLGDGSISGSFQKGFRKRVIQVFFDSSDHAELYSYLLVSTFALKPKKYPRRGCVCLSISSFLFHLFFFSFLGLWGVVFLSFGFHFCIETKKIPSPWMCLSIYQLICVPLVFLHVFRLYRRKKSRPN